MARRGLFGSLFTVAAAAAAVAGVAYLFKEEIRETETYKGLNEKYDVDEKIKTYSQKAKETAYDLNDKAKVAAKDIKSKADDWKSSKEDDIFEDDEIIINGDFSDDRDYVSLNEVAEETKDAAEDLKDAVSTAAEEVKEEAEKAVEEAKEEVEKIAEETKSEVEEINID